MARAHTDAWRRYGPRVVNVSAFDDFQLPGGNWRARLVVLVVVSVGCIVMLLTWPAASPTTSASQRSAKPTVNAPPTTTTTVDPRAISAGVAALYAHEGPTPQQLASVPPSEHSTHHGRASGTHPRR